MQKFPIYLMVLFFVSLAAAQPSIPMTVVGIVKIDGTDAPVGTIVTAEMDGETADYYELTEPGNYTLSIPGTLGDYWKEVKFYVDGIPMDQTAQWKAGDIVNIDFSISEDSTTTSSSSSTTLPSGESTSTTSSSSTTVSSTSSSSTTLPETSSTTTPGTSTTSTSTIVETTTSTVMATSSTVPTTIKPKADSGDESSPKLFLLTVLGIMLLLLLAILIVMMKRK